RGDRARARGPEARRAGGVVQHGRQHLAREPRRDQPVRRWIDRAGERALAVRLIGRLNLQPPSPDWPVRILSGGNQQKAVLAKWLARDVKVLLVDEPTRGVDVG